VTGRGDKAIVISAIGIILHTLVQHL